MNASCLLEYLYYDACSNPIFKVADYMRYPKYLLLILLIVIVLLTTTGCVRNDKGRTLQGNESTGTTIPVTTSAPGTVSVPAASFHAGYLVYPFTYTDSTGKSKTLTTAVWYPTEDTPLVQSYGQGGPMGEVSVNGRISGKGPFPLVIFSHGYGGCGLQSVFFTEELARHGYIVVAPDHDDALCAIQPGNRSRGALAEFDLRQFSDADAFTDASYVDRRDDIRAVIDEFLRLNNVNGSVFEGTIDPEKIGMSGHSLGGYTTMGVIGGWDSWHDSRIDAALMFAPFVQPYLENSDIGKIDIPVMYQGGTLDPKDTTSMQRPGGAYDSSNPPKYFLNIRNAWHMDWTFLVCSGYSSVPECIKTDDKARIIDAYGIAFFDRYLKGEHPDVLTQQDPGLAEYRYQE
jgi:predicted dienelactone hydrolase